MGRIALARRGSSRRLRSPYLGVIADSGLLARLAADCGVDFLLALSASAYREIGISTLASFLPFANSNDLAVRHAREQVLPACGELPVFVGLMAGDPTETLESRLDELAAIGVAGIVNYPSVTMTDGTLREIYEDQGCSIEAEIEMLQAAERRGLQVIAYIAAESETARRYAEIPLDAMILSAGVTHELEDVVERRDRVDRAIGLLNAVASAVRSVSAKLPCLAFGGPVTTPEDLESLLRHDILDGFVGGSVFSRLPIERAVGAALRRFKSVRSTSGRSAPAGLGPMIGGSPAMLSLYQLIERAAQYELNVCIEGESGTGKELVSAQIHRLSRRQHGPLITLNCGAIPDSLLESELFGHERGAFTGAERRRLGKFELADGGTLFLDEVGDLSPRGQVALLRAIQQREVTRVGGESPIDVDCRIICATNQPLARLVEKGRFRQDLYYRLNHLTLTIPPLRDRLEDIPQLLEPILSGLAIQLRRTISGITAPFEEKLARHSWPGNIRELQHVIYQAAFLESGPVLTGEHFRPAPGKAAPGDPREVVREEEDYSRANRALRLENARRAVHEARGNKSQAAAALGVSRKTLYQWLRGSD